VIDGAVIEGSLDGFLRAFDAKTGEVLFQFDTARTFAAVNGVGSEGRLDRCGPRSRQRTGICS
jgi:polyvinyl alcohol dehydrogenase (cytochrome)